MASVGHVMIGMAAGRLYCRKRVTTWSPVTIMTIWAGLSLLPDLDVYGFSLGVAYEAPWGHRGATHSIVFATCIALLVGLVAKPGALGRLRTFLLVEAVIVSHGLLDAMTD